jgi:hypothetical protein
MSFRSKVRKGLGNLVVVGKSRKGFQLAHLDNKGGLTPFGERFSLQREAVSYGKEKFGKKALAYKNK